MIDFLSGAVTFGYLVAALFFACFWKKAGDRLFVAFAMAFVPLALNQAIAQWLGAADERVGYTYLLGVLGFLLIDAGASATTSSRRLEFHHFPHHGDDSALRRADTSAAERIARRPLRDT